MKDIVKTGHPSGSRTTVHITKKKDRFRFGYAPFSRKMEKKIIQESFPSLPKTFSNAGYIEDNQVAMITHDFGGLKKLVVRGTKSKRSINWMASEIP